MRGELRWLSVRLVVLTRCGAWTSTCSLMVSGGGMPPQTEQRPRWGKLLVAWQPAASQAHGGEAPKTFLLPYKMPDE